LLIKGLYTLQTHTELCLKEELCLKDKLEVKDIGQLDQKPTQIKYQNMFRFIQLPQLIHKEK
jgi:hypothetical protein